MRFRILVAASISFCLLVALTYLVWFVADWENSSGRSRISFAQGRALYWHNAPARTSRVPSQGVYRALVDANNSPRGPMFFLPIWKTGTNADFELPLIWLGLATITISSGAYLAAWRRSSRRHRKGMCTACGYDLRGSIERCPECGTSRDLASPLRWPLSIIPSRAFVTATCSWVAIILAASMILVCIVIGWMGRLQRLANERYALSGLDVTHFILTTSPRLRGAVIHPQPGTFTSAITAPGSVVLLDEGAYVFRHVRGPLLHDVAIVGLSPAKTTLSLTLNSAIRVRLQNLTIDCKDNPFIDFRGGGSVSLKNCVIVNYNSGAGGSEAIEGSDTVLMIENCTIDGAGGRQHGRSLGNAFDLRGTNQVFARNSTFLNNSEICRSNCITFDGCSIGGSSPLRPYFETGIRYIRNSPTIAAPVATPDGPAFDLAMDDDAFVEIARNHDAGSDSITRRLLDIFNPSDDPRYWLGMLRSVKPEIRAIATAELKRLNYPGFPTTAPATNSSTTPSAADIARLNSLPVPFDVEITFGHLAEQIDPRK